MEQYASLLAVRIRISATEGRVMLRGFKAYLRALVLRLLRLSLRTRFFLHLALIFAHVD